MSARVVMIAIDALDFDMVGLLASDLPTLTFLMDRGTSSRLKTTFPPDSDTAWVTLSTGLTPAQHGVINFVDPLLKAKRILSAKPKVSPLENRSTWDVAADRGLQTCAVLPHMSYPGWPSRASLVVRGTGRALEVLARPHELLAMYPDPRMLQGVRGFPGMGARARRGYLASLLRQTRADAEFGARVISSRTWDFGSVYLSPLDAAGHFFMGSGPSLPEAMTDALRVAYIEHDRAVANIVDAAGPEAVVIVVSDHGHGPRPHRLFNLNALLREFGFLSTKGSRARPDLRGREALIRFGVRTVSKHRMGAAAGLLLRTMPWASRALTRPSMIDWSRTAAYASDLSGIKAYSYGGIFLTDQKSEADRHEICDAVVDIISRECRGESGQRLVEWIARREDHDDGPFLHLYPDILLQLRAEYGLGWRPDAQLLDTSPSSGLVPGSHRAGGATLVVRGAPAPPMLKAESFHDYVLTTVLRAAGRPGAA